MRNTSEKATSPTPIDRNKGNATSRPSIDQVLSIITQTPDLIVRTQEAPIGVCMSDELQEIHQELKASQLRESAVTARSKKSSTISESRVHEIRYLIPGSAGKAMEPVTATDIVTNYVENESQFIQSFDNRTKKKSQVIPIEQTLQVQGIRAGPVFQQQPYLKNIKVKHKNDDLVIKSKTVNLSPTDRIQSSITGFLKGQKQIRQKLFNMPERSRSKSPKFRQNQQNVKYYRTKDKQFKILQPTQYDTTAVLKQEFKKPQKHNLEPKSCEDYKPRKSNFTVDFIQATNQIKKQIECDLLKNGSISHNLNNSEQISQKSNHELKVGTGEPGDMQPVFGKDEITSAEFSTNVRQNLKSQGAPLQKRNHRLVIQSKKSFVVENNELPQIKHNNAFQNSFYNQAYSRLPTGSKKSLFSPKASTEGRNESISPIRMSKNPELLLGHNKFKIKAEIRNKETESKLEKKKFSLPIQKMQEAQPLVETPIYFESIDQANKQQFYYKQLKSLQQGGVVISHPYDMSHMAVTKGSFLTGNFIKHRLSQNDRSRIVNINISKTLPKKITPRQRKKDWMIRGGAKIDPENSPTIQVDRKKVFDRSMEDTFMSNPSKEGAINITERMKVVNMMKLKPLLNPKKNSINRDIAVNNRVSIGLGSYDINTSRMKRESIDEPNNNELQVINLTEHDENPLSPNSAQILRDNFSFQKQKFLQQYDRRESQRTQVNQMDSSPVVTDKLGNDSMDNRLVAYSSLGMDKLLVIHNDRESVKQSNDGNHSSPGSPNERQKSIFFNQKVADTTYRSKLSPRVQSPVRKQRGNKLQVSTVQQNSLSSSFSKSPRGRIMQTLGRKQVTGGYAGGVIGSGTNAKEYHRGISPDLGHDSLDTVENPLQENDLISPTLSKIVKNEIKVDDIFTYEAKKVTEKQGEKQSDKFKPLNMKEIQLQHSARLGLLTSEDYATIIRERIQKKTKSQKKTITPLKKQKMKRKEPVIPVQSEHKMNPQIAEFLRQKTLYDLQKDLWKVYEIQWQTFKKSDKIQIQAPIPPSVRILPFHVQLCLSKTKIENVKNLHDILTQDFPESYKEAKRRLQMCSFRIIDEKVFIEMKNQMQQGYDQIIDVVQPPDPEKTLKTLMNIENTDYSNPLETQYSPTKLIRVNEGPHQASFAGYTLTLEEDRRPSPGTTFAKNSLHHVATPDQN